MPHHSSKSSQSGSVIFYIFLAIALFAALSFAVSHIMRSGDPESISKESAKTYSSEILQYAATMRRAVHNLKIDNCDETEISFENAFVAGYTNAGAPVDKSCHIFNPKGAAISWISSAERVNDGSDWAFIGNYDLTDMGSADKDLLMVLGGVKKMICTYINDQIGITSPGGNPPSNDAFSIATKFTGTYDDGGGDVFGDNGDESNFAGQRTGCFDGPPAGTYYFYQVLVAR